MSIHIDYLKNHPNAIPALALIWHEVLGSVWIPDRKIETTEQNFRHHMNDESLPLTLIALDGDKPVGAVSLRENDGIRPDLVPWLGSLIVDKDYQRRGIGEKLVHALVKEAAKKKFNRLYLFALDAGLVPYYERLGFKNIGMDSYEGHSVTIMKIEPKI